MKTRNVSLCEPYIRKNKENILVDKNSEKPVEIIELGLSEIDKKKLSSQQKTFLICFKFKESDLNRKSGKKIINFLNDLKNRKINFTIANPVFPCMFGLSWKDVVREYNIPINCKDCLILFSVGMGSVTKSCFVLKNKQGPTLEYMKDREQLWEYFYTLLNKMKVNEICKKCIHFLRKDCEGICLRE